LQKSRQITILKRELQALKDTLATLPLDTSLKGIDYRNELNNKITALGLKILNIRDGMPVIGEKSGVRYLKGL
jgi:hypothetical protein